MIRHRPGRIQEACRRAPATAVERERARLQDGEEVKTATLVWTAGVHRPALGAASQLLLGPGGQVSVTFTL
jgi:NADH dehydrogenase FAD-containing subunit